MERYSITENSGNVIGKVEGDVNVEGDVYFVDSRAFDPHEQTEDESETTKE